jgi:Acetyltransferase (GNAT) domain
VIDVVEVGAAGPEAWDAHLRSYDGSLVYASSAFRALLRELLACRDRSLAAVEGGELRGVLPLLERDGVLNSLPYFGSNGGVLADAPEVADALISAYRELALGAGTRAATLIENPFAPGRYDDLPRTHRDERIAQWTDLPAAGVEPSAARNVRKAAAAGVVVVRDASALPRLNELHDENIRALDGRPKERRFFELVPRHLAEGEGFEVWIAVREGRTVAALLTLLWNRTVEYYTPAIEHEARPLQPLSAILDAALDDAAARGFTRWNWGGTWESQTGVHRFKRKWGARERRYAYHVHVNEPALLEAAPRDLLERFPGFYVVPFAALREPVR